MLAQLFGSDARVRVLALFLLHPDSEFYGREIGRITGLLPRAVHRELIRLTDIGILHREQRGNRVYVRVNRNHPILPELRAMFLKTAAIGDQLREKLAPLANITIAFIYGSTATNKDKVDSDIDLFLIGDTTLHQVSPVLTSLEGSLNREINVSIFAASELVTRAINMDPFITSVLSQPKIFLLGTEEELEDLLR
jgi:DNA-binding transcriptional ArsR family regulator